MGAKRDAGTSRTPDAGRDALDRLYGGSLDGFVATRRALAAELRGRGEGAAADAVEAAARPTRPAWALNQVARGAPARVEALFAAHDAAAAVQTSHDADRMRVAMRDYRVQVAAVVRAARESLERAGGRASHDHMLRVSETLAAAVVPGSLARAQFVAGQLVRDAGKAPPPDEPVDGGGALNRKDRAAERARARQRAEIEEAERRVASLETAARRARAAARRAEVAAARSEDRASRARREADAAAAHLEQARDALRARKKGA